MNIGDLCSRDLVTVTPDDTITDAAVLMREHHVGSVVVVDPEADGRRPLGVLTDRDIAIGVVADNPDKLGELLVEDVYSGELVTVFAEEDLEEALKRMRDAAVRRVPVVDAAGQLMGLLSLDDAVQALARDLSRVSRILRDQREDEAEARG